MLIGTIVMLSASACTSGGGGGASGTVAPIPGYSPGAASAVPAVAAVSGKAPVVVDASLSEPDATHMAISLSQSVVPEGNVNFLVSNDGAKLHEFVVLSTKTAADALPIVSFEGQANRINEDATGVTNVGETGNVPAGTKKLLTINMPVGHYAIVCNLPGHYKMGMHEDFWVVPKGSTTVDASLSETDATHMTIDLSQQTAAKGPVNFLVTNDGAKKHEFVVLQSKTAADSFPIVTFEGQANRIDEAATGVTNVGETGDMEPGMTKLLTIDLGVGHYAIVCNLPGHYKMGMHQDFWAVPA
jgi:uncharacterized cupredoxin-like copper-binding protein